VESLGISFNFPAAARVIRPAKDEFDTMDLCFSFECFWTNCFPIIEVNFTRDSSGTECPLESVDRRGCIFVEVDFALHAVAGTIIGESGDIDLAAI
jgi:hypothetical protein